jgi:hypothetical protein
MALLRSSLLGSGSCESPEAPGSRDGQMPQIGFGYGGRRCNLRRRPSSNEANSPEVLAEYIEWGAAEPKGPGSGARRAFLVEHQAHGLN